MQRTDIRRKNAIRVLLRYELWYNQFLDSRDFNKDARYTPLAKGYLYPSKRQ
jgi:hypothetical protein